MMSTVILIPVRLKSTRFPNKGLADLNGKPMIRRVFDRCEAMGYDTVVLTDTDQLNSVIPTSNIVITSPDCTDGTDRCISVIGRELDYDKYINVQGDNPDATIEPVQAIERALDDHYVYQAYKTMTPEGRSDPTVCKMVMTNNRVHWFCRSELAYGEFALGFHGYTQEAAERWRTFTRYPAEITETIEGLRWIQNGDELRGVQCEFDGIEINVPRDLELWRSVNK